MLGSIFWTQLHNVRAGQTRVFFADFIQGSTPILAAAQRGHTETVKILAQDFHADVNRPNSDV